MSYEALLNEVRSQTVEQTAQKLLGLTEADRKALVPPVTALVRADVSWWNDEHDEHRHPAASAALMVVGALPVAKIPAALRRLWVSTNTDREERAVIDRLLEVLQSRGLDGNPTLAAGLARRVRDNDRHFGAWFYRLAHDVMLRNPEAPVVHPAFVRIWLFREKQLLEDVRARPDWSVLALGALETRGAGQMLDQAVLRRALIRLTREELIARGELIDACIGALQATNRQVDLHGLVALHEHLAVSNDEVRARAGQYVSIVAGAPAFVATQAQLRLQALDEAGRLQPAELAQISAAVLVRPEKGLFRAQLTWLRSVLRSAAEPVRESLVSSAVVGLGHPDPALQKQLLNLLRPYRKDWSEGTRLEIARAAETVAPDLSELVAELTGLDPAASAPVPVAQLPQPLPAAALVPIVDVELLAEEIAVFFQGRDWDAQIDPALLERLLEALVRFAWRDPEGLHKALGPVLTQMGWLAPQTPPRIYQSDHPFAIDGVRGGLACAVQAAQAGADRPVADRHQQPVRPEELPRLESPRYDARAGAVVLRRVAEIVAGIWWAPVPVLLATPSTTDGRLEAAELRRRLLLVEAAGVRPWPEDLNQAWLRVRPSDREQLLEEVQRVAGPAGAERLTKLGAARAEVRLEPWTRQIRGDDYYFEQPAFATDVLAVLTPVSSLPEPWDRLWRLPIPPDDNYFHDSSGLSCWPWMLPFDREAIAAHLIRGLADISRGSADVLRAHAEVPGPIGSAGRLLYCGAMGLSAAGDRAGAAEAVVTLLGRGELDTAEFGDLLGRLLADRSLKLPRVIESLRNVGQAGAWPQLWQILAAALPHCLPAATASEPATAPLTRLSDLLALAVEAVQLSVGPGAVAGSGIGEIAGLDEFADRPGSSKARSEARRLRAALAGHEHRVPVRAKG